MQLQLIRESRRNFNVPVPPLAEQQRFVTEVEILENAIAAAQNTLDAAPTKKQTIMLQYL
jgi:restriction endonuclease S subunit